MVQQYYVTLALPEMVRSGRHRLVFLESPFASSTGFLMMCLKAQRVWGKDAP